MHPGHQQLTLFLAHFLDFAAGGRTADEKEGAQEEHEVTSIEQAKSGVVGQVLEVAAAIASLMVGKLVVPGPEKLQRWHGDERRATGAAENAEGRAMVGNVPRRQAKAHVRFFRPRFKRSI